MNAPAPKFEHPRADPYRTLASIPSQPSRRDDPADDETTLFVCLLVASASATIRVAVAIALVHHEHFGLESSFAVLVAVIGALALPRSLRLVWHRRVARFRNGPRSTDRTTAPHT